MEQKMMISNSIDTRIKLFILLLVECILLSACGSEMSAQSLELVEEKTVEIQPEERKIFENHLVDGKGEFDKYGDQYSRIETEDGGYEVTLYDRENKVVYKDILPKYPWIYEMTDDILQIGMSGGSLSAYIFYYDKERAKVSPYFADSFYLRDNYIAYMEDEKTLVLTDIFDDDELYMEITRNFSDSRHMGGMYLSIKNIKWITLNGQDVVVLEYYEGEERELIFDIIPVGDEEAVVVYKTLEEIEREHEILEYDICSSSLYDFENVHPMVKVQAEHEIVKNEEISQKYGKELKISLDYHIFDFNDDGIDDCLMCIERELYDGSVEHWIRIFIVRHERISVTRQKGGEFYTTQEKGDIIVWPALTINLPLCSQSEDTGHKRITVLNEKTGGYYSIVIPDSNLILRYNEQYDEYEFYDQ